MYTPQQRLMRSNTEKVLAGVAGGIALYLAIDPVIVRLAFIALTFTGVGLLLYPILWVIMPLASGTTSAPTPASPPVEQAEFKQQRQAGYDSMTGQPVGDETEIPISNVGSSAAPPAPAGRNRQFGILLLGVGALVLASIVLGPLFGKLIFPVLLIGAGVLAMRRA